MIIGQSSRYSCVAIKMGTKKKKMMMKKNFCIHSRQITLRRRDAVANDDDDDEYDDEDDKDDDDFNNNDNNTRLISTDVMRTMTATRRTRVTMAKCYGCGAKVQTDDDSEVGFVETEEYQIKLKNRQLSQLLCLRCANLANGKMINAVVGQGGAKISKGLITPEELKESLRDIRLRKNLVVKIVDCADFHGSFLPKIRDLVGSNPILLIVTKCDVLPKTCDFEKMKEYVIKECERKKLTLAGDPIFVSARSKDQNIGGMKQAVLTTLRERRGRDVYVVGAANVGKSTFVREFTNILRAEMGNLFAPKKRLPTASSMPGTTLGIIPIKAFEDRKTLYDTPGVFLHHRVNSLLTGDQMKELRLGGDLKAYRAPFVSSDYANTTDKEPKLKNVSFDWNGLVRMDIIDAPETDDLNTVNVTFYGPKKMRVFKSTVDEMQKRADSTFTNYDQLDDDDEKTKQFYASLPSLRIARDVEISLDDYEGKDLAISGLGGWIRIVRERNHSKFTNSQGDKGNITVRVWSLPGVEVFVRDCMPL